MTRIKISAFLMLAFAAFVANAETDTEAAYKQVLKAEEVFHQANSLQKQDAATVAMYLKAAEIYQSIIDEYGIENSGLYYNLANSYLLGDDIGRAILNYKRALKLDDSNYDIRKNLDYARSKCATKIETKTQKKAVQKLFFWHYYLSTPVKFLVSVVSVVVLLWVVILRLWSIKMPGFWAVLSISFLLFLAFTSSVCLDQYNAKYIKEGVVVAESVVARQGDSENYEKSFEEPLHAGVEFTVIENRQDWIYVELKNGQKTWLPAKAIAII